MVTTPHPAAVVRPVAAAVAVACAASAALVLLLVAVHCRPLMAFDSALSNGLHRAAVGAPGWTRVSRLLTDRLWDPWTMRAGLAVTVGWLVRRGERLLGFWVAATSLAGTALQQGLKAVVDRPRPVWPDPVASAHYSAFPSGHALSVTVAGGLALWLLHRHGVRRAGQVTAAVAVGVSMLGVGFTRVHLGVHWPSDVAGGWLLGGAVAAGSVAAHAAYERRRGGTGRGEAAGS
ncbi:phosphatase PAP2 family protein [Streptomyces pinistramenti]|uniref:phosphatase PAP2 family protein n=1 Tax=Streptomyces pinistramenti TaxID=2884812 RepID=UPI001D074B65|nr:phosphatase PAP2 family protein [Streptomyces pinistramenti]MCB5909161.1 phosphatase PAP2 family protein [Streptomyces pinistramenti]